MQFVSYFTTMRFKSVVLLNQITNNDVVTASAFFLSVMQYSHNSENDYLAYSNTGKKKITAVNFILNNLRESIYIYIVIYRYV